MLPVCCRLPDNINALFVILVALVLNTVGAFNSEKVLYAVNCGGQAHTDIYGVSYRADHLMVGVASDYGTKLEISRVDSNDATLYQTERYADHDFTYEMPNYLNEDGEYTLVLKFCEVYFRGADQKVFNIELNSERIVSDLDIWKRAGGHGIAFDITLPIRVKGSTAFVGNSRSGIDISKGIKLTFSKGLFDNPKINAFYLYKGPPSEIPPLPELSEQTETEDEEAVEEEVEVEKQSETKRYAEGPPAPDPYKDQDTSHALIPILVALACFFPILFCLCKL